MELKKRVKLRTQLAKSGTITMYVVTLPKEYVEALGWQKGDILEIILDTEKKEIRIREG